MDICPSEQLIDAATAVPILVDVGGGHGYDLQNFIATHPGAGARLVLQDLPSITCNADVGKNDGICVMSHDFFHPNQSREQKPKTSTTLCTTLAMTSQYRFSRSLLRL